MKKKKKGNALIVAVLLSAIIGGAAIGVAAVASRQLRISETYNKGIQAFYAAESGLEQGLLYYKYNPDQEIPEIIGLDKLDPTDASERKPLNVYRNFLERATMRQGTGDEGQQIGYATNLREQVYDLQVFYKQKFYGDDNSEPKGVIDARDIKATSKNTFLILKDDAQTFQILPENNNISIYWKWTKPCNSKARALEVKIKVKETNPVSGKNEYTTIFRDPRCSAILRSTNATEVSTGVFAPSGSGDLKGTMGISALTATELTIKPVGNTAASNDSVYFGFNQYASGSTGTSKRTTGPTTTIKSIGYYNGTTRQITANINRQNGSIMDLFQYVIYQGAQNGT